MDNSVEQLRLRIGGNWPNIFETRRRTDDLLHKLSILSDFSSEDASVVVFGSVGRGEVTENSDVDWTLLIDGPSDPNHAYVVMAIRDRLESAGLVKPGETGTFGVMAFSHDLIHYIAGTHDTNQNLTRRLLLLLESVAVTEPLVRGKVIRNVLDRYITHDIVAPVAIPPKHVIPHFLLNDVVRYWRTMASDFPAKMWERQNEGWGLRNIKLRFSRKLILAAGLLACFSFETDPPANAGLIRGDQDNLPSTLANHVLERLDAPPLDVLAGALTVYGSPQTARKVFDAYDQFLGIMLDHEKREELKQLPIDKALNSKVWVEARDASHAFRDGLEELFLRSSSLLSELTLRFGVF
ncbi:MAG: nucleotidyltransferase domain-containing protein [Thermoanaerobaculia bacterium]